MEIESKSICPKASEEELKQLARPLVDHLRKYHHPHTAIIITSDRVDVLESLAGIPFPFMEDESNTIHLKASVDTSELDRVMDKAKELNSLLENASSLVKELASVEINLSVKVEN